MNALDELKAAARAYSEACAYDPNKKEYTSSWTVFHNLGRAAIIYAEEEKSTRPWWKKWFSR